MFTTGIVYDLIISITLYKVIQDKPCFVVTRLHFSRFFFRTYQKGLAVLKPCSS